ncbi:MAG: hypothetical protein H7X79_06345, partial [Sporomusaceae bacterium]|nr:hypothetical protein [Sporomusaceae bacterium]
MDSAQLVPILLAPISFGFGAMILLLGLYSLKFNVADAQYKNHPRAEKTARMGGWLYIIGGAAMMIQQMLSG